MFTKTQKMPPKRKHSSDKRPYKKAKFDGKEATKSRKADWPFKHKTKKNSNHISLNQGIKRDKRSRKHVKGKVLRKKAGQR